MGGLPTKCPIFNVPLMVLKENNKMRHPQSPSLDRIDPNKGYVKGNVRIISWRANELKGNASLEEIRMILADLEKTEKENRERRKSNDTTT